MYMAMSFDEIQDPQGGKGKKKRKETCNERIDRMTGRKYKQWNQLRDFGEILDYALGSQNPSMPSRSNSSVVHPISIDIFDPSNDKSFNILVINALLPAARVEPSAYMFEIR